MRDDRNADGQAKLDHKMLLGFRNLVGVKGCDDDLRQKSELAFTKQGTETPPPTQAARP